MWKEEADDDEAGDEEALWLDDVVEWLDGCEDVKWELMVEECALKSVEWEIGLECAPVNWLTKAFRAASRFLGTIGREGCEAGWISSCECYRS